MSFYLQHHLYFKTPFVALNPKKSLGIIVVIPCYNEVGLLNALSSLSQCEKPDCSVEVTTVFNSAASDSDVVVATNTKMLNDALKWSSEQVNDWINFHFIDVKNISDKDAGVGLARKIGMDEAVIRFEELNKDGIIACFDADATCQLNYLVELEKHFKQHPESPACSIHFEHPIEGKEFSKQNYEAIAAYELHLRYYKNALKFCGFPYAFHTIGSSMAVKSKAYQKQGGMNKRKAGEDFYFLQKMMVLGGFTELTTTTIFPSPRISDRVPFGTGRAMQNYLRQENPDYLTYDFQSFLDLKVLVDSLDELYNLFCHSESVELSIDLPKSVSEYLKTIDFAGNILKIRDNSTSFNHFKKLFYNWFNAFKVLKFMHFSRDNFYKDVWVEDAAKELLNLLKLSSQNEKELLTILRKIDVKE
ncbi:MAG: glycosyltransferase family 2 protein [Flavobacteriales bacterium]|nr:glycosyltransferase family 2 protein [Flavobacteriales bacterium]